MKKLSSFEIKIIAMITMVIDHVGAIFFPELTILRIIGRLSFPLFCFLAVQAYIHTGNIYRYLGRLAVCALVSEIFYDLAFFGTINLNSHNGLFTLLAGVASLMVMSRQGYVTGCVFTIVSGYFLNMLHVNYGLYGTVLIVLIYFAYRFCMETQKSMFLSWGIVGLYMVFFKADIQAFGVFAIIFMVLYSGQKGYESKHMRTFFYIFYPLHLLIIDVVNILIKYI